MPSRRLPIRTFTGLLVAAILVAAGIWTWDRYGRKDVEIPQPESFADIDPEVVETVNNLIKDCRRRNRFDNQYLTLAKTYHANALIPLATKTYSIYLGHKPRDIQAWYLNGLCLEKLGEIPAAIESVQKCIDLKTKYTPAYWRLALWKSEQGEYDEALKLLDRADALDSKDRLTKLVRAKCLIAKNESAMALEVLENSDFEGTANENYARFLTGTALRQQGERSRAATYLSDSNVSPQWFDEWSSDINNHALGIPWKRIQATLFYRSGQLDRAFQLFEEIVRTPLADFRDWNSLGLIHLAKGDFKQAISCFDAAIDDQPADYWLYLNLANSQYLAGQEMGMDIVEKSLVTLETAIKMRPERPEPYEAKAQSLQVLKRNELALEAFNQACDRTQEVALCDWRRLFLLIEMKEWNRAQKHLDLLAVKSSSEPYFLIVQATVDLEKGRTAAARGALDRIRQTSFSDPFLQQRFSELKAKLQ